jgi:recombination protein RecT
MATTAVVKRTVVDEIQRAKPQFQGRLPEGMTVDRFMYGLSTHIQKQPALLDCTPQSLILAGYEAAELGINLSPSLQLGYIIKYGNAAQFQIGYRGLIQRAYETGAVKSFFAEVVYVNDKFTRELAPRRVIRHEPATSDRGDAVGVYALVEFEDGHFDFEFLTKAQVETRRGISKAPNSLMWTKFWEEGWRKTAIRVLAKRLPLTNPQMEKLAEVIAKDEEGELEVLTAGAVEFEPDSALKVEAPGKVSYTVGKHNTTVSGATIPIKDFLSKKLGGKPSGRAWLIPSSATQELVDHCAEKGIPVEELGGEVLEGEIWPKEEAPCEK